MKKILFLLITFILSFGTFGCTSVEEKPLSTMENLEEEPLDYKIENIVLSKGFQSLGSNVEVLEKNKSLKLLASVGLIEGSGIEINKVTKLGKTINIYINRLLEKGQAQLSVPQVKFEIYNTISERPEDLNFNIINENYEPISLKFNKNQILDKIYTQFKIEPNTIPYVALSRYRGDIIWTISFTNIFDKENPVSPLINLNVEVDALTGEVLDSEKDTISTYIDDGYLLDYIHNSYLLYKRKHVDDVTNYESLWTYNLETGERSNIYTSRNIIHSALFSPDGEYVSLIEIDESKTETDLYMIHKSDKIAYKITPINHLQPRLIKWKDNILYFIDIKDDTSTLLTYDVEENKSNVQFSLNKVIESFDILDNTLLFTESNQDALNKNIYLTKNGASLKEVGTGFRASFLDDSNIIYLENTEKEDKNILNIYNIEKDSHKHSLDFDITNYYKLNDDEIVFIQKESCNNNYMLTEYSLKDKSVLSTSQINSDRIFFDSNKKKGYITLAPPHEDNNRNIIYSIDLNKLSVVDNEN